MVVFTCNYCGDSLQKPKVQKHYAFVCRKPKFLTCVDCFKDFREEEYATHIKCVTEEERYAAKGSMPNGVVKKGEVKQESWIELVRSILEKEPHVKPSLRNLLNNILMFNNIPRKKNKFLNFIKNSLGGRVNMKDVEEVWNLLEKYKNEQSNTNIEKNIKESEPNGTNDMLKDEIKEINNAKRKNMDEDGTNTDKKKARLEELVEQEVQTENEKFSFQDKIISILNKKGSISFEKLQKKVLNAYLKHSEETEITPKMLKKFRKKLNNIPKVEIKDDHVSFT